MEAQLGWNYAPDGIMFCPLWRRRVCPSKVVLYGLCHVLFVNGVFNLHAGLFLTNLKALSNTPAAIGECVKIWIWPHNISSAIKPGKAFGTARLKWSMGQGQLKCSASEGLSLLPALANYCEALLKLPSPVVRVQAQLFLDLAKVVGEIIRSGRKLMSKAALHCLVTKYIKDYKATFGEEKAPPKFHMLPIYANLSLSTSRIVLCMSGSTSQSNGMRTKCSTLLVIGMLPFCGRSQVVAWNGWLHMTPQCFRNRLALFSLAHRRSR